MAEENETRREALRELVNGSGLAVLWTVFWDLIREGSVLSDPAGWAILFLGVVLVLLVLRRLDLLRESRNWGDIPPWRTFLTPFGVFLALGFGIIIAAEVWTPERQPFPGGTPPGAQPGAPLWFWIALVVVMAGIAVGMYIRSKQPGSQLPPGRHLEARLAGLIVGGLSGAGLAWTTIAVVGEGPLHSEPLMTSLVLLYAVVVGLFAWAFPVPGDHPSRRAWSAAIAIGAAVLLGAASRGLISLTFEVPIAAAALGSAGMAIVGTIRYAHHREGSGSPTSEAE